ncbi:MAG: nucleoside 2-deoxyribosyltransferase [Alphaproteobacteria bacterium]|nr:nucleoside 2-deoxyribosyltransferase [Alphaproteobacteria bacterium]
MTIQEIYEEAAARAKALGFETPVPVYLAGPEVFLPDAVAIGLAKKRICAAHGLDGLFPFDNEVDVSQFTPEEAGVEISRKNEALMDRASAIIANVTPWHGGPSLDVGTGFEIGYMRALRKPLFLYSNDGRSFYQRVRAHFGDDVYTDAQGHTRARADDTSIENFGGMRDNLMFDGAVISAKGVFIAATKPDVYRDLDLFTQLVQKAASHFYTRPQLA